MKFKMVLIAILAGCASSNRITVAEVNIADGINKQEAQALAADYLKIHNLAPNIFIAGMVESEYSWEVVLQCETQMTIPVPVLGGRAGISSDKFIKHEAGVLEIAKLDGFVYFGGESRSSGHDLCMVSKRWRD